ncbi:MAG: protein translocase subunit SecF [Rickettsiaceae bacterium]|nr:protein translocase subunit SecF [Rickettsiaceae bacterium]
MRIYPLRIIDDNLNISFTHLKLYSFGISILLSIASIILCILYGLNLGIDFTGGILIEAKLPGSIINQVGEISELRHSLNKLNIGEISLQTASADNEIIIKIGKTKNGNSKEIIAIAKSSIEKIAESQEAGPNKVIYKKIDFVGPQVGSILIWSGIQSIILCFIGIMIYVAIRFEWQFGLGVLIALIHDVILSIGFMSITHLDFTLSSVAALLTIVGYSVNDSVVIYDRVRENMRKYHSKTIDDIINISTNETLSRTTMTVITTLIANLSLVIWGGEELYSFSVLVFFGISAGTYSSIFISAPILKNLGVKAA